MPAGSVYFVSFYITRYPRDLDSIYFLLALRHECTGPIFDVGGRIFSGRNDRWIFLYFPFPRHHLFLLHSILFPPGTLASFNRDITLHTPTASQNNTKFDLPGGTRELQWIPIQWIPFCFYLFANKLRLLSNFLASLCIWLIYVKYLLYTALWINSDIFTFLEKLQQIHTNSTFDVLLRLLLNASDVAF